MSLVLVVAIPFSGGSAEASGPDAARLLETINSVGPDGAGVIEAGRALRQLTAAGPAVLPDVLAAIDRANPRAANYLRAAAETIADRALAAGQELPAGRLLAFVEDRRHDPRARRLAFELLRRVDNAAAERLVPSLLTDPSGELRREAVQRKIELAEGLMKLHALADGPQRAAISELATGAYRAALTGAVDDDQVKAIVGPLRKLGHPVDLREHFGFITEWQVIGPFDHRGGIGLDAVYPPEREIDFGAEYDGQLGRVRWQPISTGHEYGIVDIAKQLENYKGSCMYLAAEFHSPERRNVQVRLGTPNSWKLWLNGRFLFGREEYHRGMKLDQYPVEVELQAGRNVILFKICQNEQDEDWAQRYEFQLRVCDPSGAAVRSQPPGQVGGGGGR
ncbi:MAG TPA: hypothetical protein VML55_07200 [Planctomycetaceae bacterium]|nr:hypothetical protein [Planctomycetaceae bacterium]